MREDRKVQTHKPTQLERGGLRRASLVLQLAKYSVGVGDRFARQAAAQLQACVLAAERGVQVVPVWNKSHREHLLTGSDPPSVRAAAATAVQKLEWKNPWHVDADHIRLETVDPFIGSSDFFTIDVADFIGTPAPPAAVKAFVDRHPEISGRIEIPGIPAGIHSTRPDVERIANKFLFAVIQAAAIHRHIAQQKGEDPFITEISMDETDSPQTPAELLVILAAVADERIPLQTIAPKFSGRFLKGIDYVGNLAHFQNEFDQSIALLAFAVAQYRLPKNLKLSVHSGSDKFSLYGLMRGALRRHDAGLHLKTAGTTWLEELLGLAEAGGPALAFAKQVYAGALARIDELCAPYASVIDIDRARLPSATTVSAWSSEQYAAALRHDSTCPEFNPSLRQLLHVGYKIAAENREAFFEQLRASEPAIARNVTRNLFDRHLRPLFLGERGS